MIERSGTKSRGLGDRTQPRPLEAVLGEEDGGRFEDALPLLLVARCRTGRATWWHLTTVPGKDLWAGRPPPVEVDGWINPTDVRWKIP